MFLDKAIRYTQLTMEDSKNVHVLPELLISKEVLEDYCGEHKLACTGEQIGRYYQAYHIFCSVPAGRKCERSKDTIMKLDTAFFDKLSRLRLSMGQRTSMNLTGNRKSMQKGTSMEFSDFREYMAGDDIRRIDWNAYGRLDRLYVKEYMEEKEAVVSILLDTSASMDYGAKKKGDLACTLAAALAYLGLNNMDRVLVYDMKNMQQPFAAGGGKRALPRLVEWLSQCSFEGTANVSEAVRMLPAKGTGITVIISDFLQEEFVQDDEEAAASVEKLLRFLAYRRQKSVLLHILAGEERAVDFSGTKNLIDMEEESTLRLTVDAASIRVYEKALSRFLGQFERACAKNGAFYAVCDTTQDIYQLIFQDLKMLYDI